MRTSTRRQPGFMLLEVMFVVGLLAIVGLLVSQIYFACANSVQRVSRQQAAQTRFDQAVRQMRRDVWNASSCTLSDPHALRIELPDGKSIEWSTGQFLHRSIGDKHQAWDELQSDLHFEVSGPTVAIVQDPAEGEAGGRVVLAQELALLKGARP